MSYLRCKYFSSKTYLASKQFLSDLSLAAFIRIQNWNTLRFSISMTAILFPDAPQNSPGHRLNSAFHTPIISFLGRLTDPFSLDLCKFGEMH